MDNEADLDIFERECRILCLVYEEFSKMLLFCLFRALLDSTAIRESVVGWKRNGMPDGIGGLCLSCCIFRLISANAENNVGQMED